MGKLWADFLNVLGLAYWITVTTDSQGQQNTHLFGPFTTPGAAVAAQDQCCQHLRENLTKHHRIRTIRVSTEC